MFEIIDPAPGSGILQLAVVAEAFVAGVVDPLHVRTSLPGSRPATSVLAELQFETVRAKIERVFYQGSLFGTLVPEFDPVFGELNRLDLDATTWVDLAPGWLAGADQVYDELLAMLPFQQRTGPER